MWVGQSGIWVLQYWGGAGEGVPYARDGGREAPEEGVPLPPRRMIFELSGLPERGPLPPSPGPRRTG